MQRLIIIPTLALLAFNSAADAETAEDKMTAEFMTKSTVESFARPGGISKFNGHWATYYEADDFGGPAVNRLLYVGSGFNWLKFECEEGLPVVYFGTDNTQYIEGSFSGQARFGNGVAQPIDLTGYYRLPNSFGENTMIMIVEITWADYNGIVLADGKAAFKTGSIVAKTDEGLGYLGKEFRDSCHVK